MKTMAVIGIILGILSMLIGIGWLVENDQEGEILASLGLGKTTHEAALGFAIWIILGGAYLLSFSIVVLLRHRN